MPTKEQKIGKSNLESVMIYWFTRGGRPYYKIVWKYGADKVQEVTFSFTFWKKVFNWYMDVTPDDKDMDIKINNRNIRKSRYSNMLIIDSKQVSQFIPVENVVLLPAEVGQISNFIQLCQASK